MNQGLRIYQYFRPALLTPLSLALWRREYELRCRRVTVWPVPILWAYIVPGVGTNVCKVWEFDVAWKLGRFRPHHGFVFGSATSMLAWIVHGHHAVSFADLCRYALHSGLRPSASGIFLYEIKALRIGLLTVPTSHGPTTKGGSDRSRLLSMVLRRLLAFSYGAFISAVEFLYRFRKPV